MGEFSKMTDRELRRWIADRLGYCHIRDDINNSEAYKLLRPDGTEFGAHVGGIHRYTLEELYDMVPGWPTSVESALSLPMPYVMRLEMVRYPYDANYVAMECRREYNGVTVVQEFTGECDGGPEKMARAICEAWAAMMEAVAEAVHK